MIFTDQMKRTIRLEKFPQRIVSLVPSQTELLFELGLDQEVIGITKFCIHPQHWFDSKQRVGGTKNVSIEKISALQPDLIIANKEENTLHDIEQLQKIYPVYISDIYTVQDALEMIDHVGKICNRAEQADKLVNQIKFNFDQIEKVNLRVLYFIWTKPWMLAGNHTFISDVLTQCGLVNVVNGADQRYPEISIEKIKELKPDVLFLSSEPFPFKENHATALQAETGIRTELVDGEIFSWYGSRMLKIPDYLTQLKQRLQHNLQ
ncbi:MAG: ABC transporter substrate-binding protein [Crocinitomicaceae bacterium]|nr:ABC transporter substrate-binding protein [Crocinitomicaceae bacterium]MBK8925350.1 ABC transporter substrate-binding protein [Crocinitomicaceae bacterium]